MAASGAIVTASVIRRISTVPAWSSTVSQNGHRVPVLAPVGQRSRAQKLAAQHT